MSARLLSARGLTVQRGGQSIFSDLNVTVPEGALIAILGPSGCGKSTLLNALSGFRPADKGSVTIGGADIYEDFDGVKGDLGFVPQDDIVPRALRVRRVLHYAALLRLPHFTEDAREGRVNGVLQALGLNEHANKRVSKLSGGQRKRVSIATELLAKPKILFADEPGSGLDPALERELSQELRKLTRGGRSIVVTTHILSSLDLYDIVVVLAGGGMSFFGPPNQLKTHFAVDDTSQIYTHLGKESAKKWNRRFHDTPMAAWAAGKTPFPLEQR